MTPCEHCAIIAPEDECPDGDHEAYWIDTDGAISDDPSWVCESCLHAGHPDGPGYATPERAERLRGERKRDEDELAADRAYDEMMGK